MALKNETPVLKFHCENDDQPNCATCPRDFLVAVHAVDAAWKDSLGHAVLMMRSTLPVGGRIGCIQAPHCPIGQPRYIHSSIPWDEFISAFSDLADMGSCRMASYAD